MTNIKKNKNVIAFSILINRISTTTASYEDPAVCPNLPCLENNILNSFPTCQS